MKLAEWLSKQPQNPVMKVREHGLVILQDRTDAVDRWQLWRLSDYHVSGCYSGPSVWMRPLEWNDPETWYHEGDAEQWKLYRSSL